MADTTVAVVGTGLIGASWTAYFLGSGLAVRAFDPAPGFVDSLVGFVERAWPSLVAQGLGKVPWQGRLYTAKSLADAVEGADWVQESGPENVALKRELFAQMDAAAPPEAVLASSSTALMPSQIQERVKGAHRTLVGHPFNPPHLVPLVEVVGGQRTAPETIARAMKFYESIGKVPVHIRQELPGHLANRLQAALYREAVHLVTSGAATVEDVDKAVSAGPGMRLAIMGPHLTYHLAGGPGGIADYLEKLGPSQEARWAALGSPALTPETKQALIEGMEKAVKGRTVEELESERDRLLLGILELKRRVT
jgi:carnitine 3-dehydrogenase